uniref:CDT1 domain-containing protein n=1 Tax=Steinernema glaseri TaxID=37863 RepID=A0A1I7YZR0_9BILA
MNIYESLTQQRTPAITAGGPAVCVDSQERRGTTTCGPASDKKRTLWSNSSLALHVLQERDSCKHEEGSLHPKTRPAEIYLTINQIYCVPARTDQKSNANNKKLRTLQKTMAVVHPNMT